VTKRISARLVTGSRLLVSDTSRRAGSASRYDDLRKFFERIAYDEATSAVLKEK
jgi:hypothetical protein